MAMTKKNLAIQARKAQAAHDAKAKKPSPLKGTTVPYRTPPKVAALLKAANGAGEKRKNAPGAGRPEVSAALRLKVVSARVNEKQSVKFKRLGGGDWLRDVIDKATIPAKAYQSAKA